MSIELIAKFKFLHTAILLQKRKNIPTTVLNSYHGVRKHLKDLKFMIVRKNLGTVLEVLSPVIRYNGENVVGRVDRFFPKELDRVDQFFGEMNEYVRLILFEQKKKNSLLC